MEKQMIKNIQLLQVEYAAHLDKYKCTLLKPVLKIEEITMFIDSVKCFWLKHKDIVELEIEELPDDISKFMLSGVMSVNLDGLGHFYFKSFGDLHFIADPFLKMDEITRASINAINVSEIIEMFQGVYLDTLRTTTDYPGCFNFIPFRDIAIPNMQNHRELIDKSFYDFISNIFKTKIKSEPEFCKQFNTFEEIELKLGKSTLQHMVFNGLDDSELSLRERIDKYCSSKQNGSMIKWPAADSSKFIAVLLPNVFQILDLFVSCYALRLIPYFRSEVLLNYFIIVKRIFEKNEKMKSQIEKTLVFYILSRAVCDEMFDEIDFSKYCKHLENKRLLDKVLERIHASGIDVLGGGVKKTGDIILEEINPILSELRNNPSL